MKRFSHTIKIVTALLVGVFSNGLLSPMIAYAHPGGGSDGTRHEVVCHAKGNGGWVPIPPDKSSEHIVDGQPSTHGVHVNDFLIYVTYPAGVAWNELSQEIRDDIDMQCNQNPSVTPAAVTFSDSCGLAHDSYTIPSTPHVIYKVNNTAVEAGTYSVAEAGKVRVTASAAPQYKVAQGAVTEWSHTFTNEPCVPNTPTVVAHQSKCSLYGASTGAVSASVTNIDDETDASVTYSWQIKLGTTVVKSGTTNPIVDGASDTLSADGLAAGSYTLTINGSDGTTASDTFVVETCVVLVTPPVPAAADFCYADIDTVRIPSEVAGVRYSQRVGETLVEVTGDVQYRGTDIVIVAQPRDGYAFPEGTVSEWVFGANHFTNEQCVTVTKTGSTPTDTNHDGIVSVGDHVTWTITLTNNGTQTVDTFDLTVIDAGATFAGSNIITDLAPGDSVSLTVTTPLSATDIQTCKTQNVVSFTVDNLDDNMQAGGSANATVTFTCPTPVRGEILATTAPAPLMPTTLPATGAGTTPNPLLIVAASVLAYGATFALQGRRKLLAVEG